jgi:hypothetical protein
MPSDLVHLVSVGVLVLLNDQRASGQWVKKQKPDSFAK